MRSWAGSAMFSVQDFTGTAVAEAPLPGRRSPITRASL
jgi:hypothetical protein